MNGDYIPVSVDHAELLRYHLTVTQRVDDENAKREHTRALAALAEPAVHPVHQLASISHAAQKTPVNVNNVNAAKVHEAAKAVIAEDDKEFQQLTEAEAERSRKAMAEQISGAEKRTASASAGDPNMSITEANETATKAPTIPTWKP